MTINSSCKINRLVPIDPGLVINFYQRDLIFRLLLCHLTELIDFEFETDLFLGVKKRVRIITLNTQTKNKKLKAILGL